ncbi:MAG: homoserine kinase [Gammaproteobacteria bacterium]
MKTVTGFAPASVGNVGVGFDILGHAIAGIGDEVTLTASNTDGILIGSIEGVTKTLPFDPQLNTASRPLLAMRRDLGISQGVRVDIQKGVSLGSGMGGSAASAVAAVVAADQLWQLDLEWTQLLSYALIGEEVASGTAHPDNVAASLIGGLVLCEQTEDRVHPTRLPVPKDLRCVLIHPEITIATEEARALLETHVSLQGHVQQSQCLAGFIAGCCRGDTEQIGRCLKDLIIEPQRSALIPGFDALQKAALENGALGMSISGSGPSVFAWVRHTAADLVAAEMSVVLDSLQIPYQCWITEIDVPGARIIRGD